MIHYSLITFLFVISTNNFLTTALDVERIVGGHPADCNNTLYQVGIVAKENKSNIRIHIGGGAIIGRYYVASTLINFFTPSYELKKLTFYVVAGSNDINDPKIFIDIEEIYMTDFQSPTLFNDIAVAKLKESFNNYNLALKKVKVLQREKSYIGKSGIVTGYGYNWVQTANDLKTEENINSEGPNTRVLGHSDGLLRYANVDIVDPSHCKSIFPFFRDIFQICGTMNATTEGESAGICTGDRGNPLVIGNTLVGLASLSPVNCSNTFYGAIYTNVSRFMFFTNSILRGEWQSVAIAHKNRLHIPPI